MDYNTLKKLEKELLKKFPDHIPLKKGIKKSEFVRLQGNQEVILYIRLLIAKLEKERV
jgi:hypothetical protein